MLKTSDDADSFMDNEINNLAANIDALATSDAQGEQDTFYSNINYDDPDLDEEINRSIERENSSRLSMERFIDNSSLDSLTPINTKELNNMDLLQDEVLDVQFNRTISVSS